MTDHAELRRLAKAATPGRAIKEPTRESSSPEMERSSAQSAAQYPDLL